MNSDIMTISRFRMGTDGKGVSTLVAFFDCPLHCKYCVNDFCHKDSGMFCTVPRGEYTPRELLSVLQMDDIYYQMSGGGIVFGGGEPLLQSAFIHEVCELANPAWKKRVETSLNVAWSYVEPIVNDMDEWIIDIKDMNSDIYRKYTGADNHNVISNLLKLKAGVDSAKLRIRIPRIPEYNDETNINRSVEWIRENMNVEPEVFDYIEIPLRTRMRSRG